MKLSPNIPTYVWSTFVVVRSAFTLGGSFRPAGGGGGGGAKAQNVFLLYEFENVEYEEKHMLFACVRKRCLSFYEEGTGG